MIALLLAVSVQLNELELWKREVVCWQGPCGQRVVNLGSWDPRPLDWDTSAYGNAPTAPSAPQIWGY